MKLLRYLTLSSTGKTIHCPIVDHSVIEDPNSVGHCQEVGNNTMTQEVDI